MEDETITFPNETKTFKSFEELGEWLKGTNLDSENK